MYKFGGAVMNLYEGIFYRKSVRSFLMEPLEQRLLDNILNFANHLENLTPEQTVKYEIIKYVEEKHSFIEHLTGGNSPYYLVLHAKKTEDYLLNAGYLLEQIVLYMTTKGLGTCYLGMKRLKSTEELEPVIAVAFGKPKKEFFEEECNAHRKPIHELVCYKTEVTEDVKEIAKAGRLAPSSLNSQPWRFVVYDNRIHLFCRKEKLIPEVMKKVRGIDMGIALAHLIVAAEEFWYSPQVTKLPNISEQKFKQHEYIITVLLS